MNQRKFLVIDSNSVIHRAFHALPPLTNKEGGLVNAVYGFFSVLIRVANEINPSCIITTFDLPGPTFRHEKYCDYKAKRSATPEDLIDQFFLIKDGLKKMGVPIIEKEGFEADDMIGTIANIISNKEMGDSIILSGDKDVLQLIGENTKVILLKKEIKDLLIYDRNLFSEEYRGINPCQLIEVKALQGDMSDNIPGVFGIGEKTAIDLIMKYENLEGIYKKAVEDESLSLNVRNRLAKGREDAFLSRDLSRIRTDVDIDIDFDSCHWRGFEVATAFFENMGFSSLVKRVENSKVSKNLSLF